MRSTRFGTMRRQILWVIGAATILVLVLTWAFVTNAAGNGPLPTPSTNRPTVAPNTIGGTMTAGGSLLFPNGVPVQATVSAATSSSSTEGIPAVHPTQINSDPHTPAFTAQDAEQYVASHPALGKVGTSETPTGVNVQFLTGAQYKAQVNARSSLPDTNLLCVVQESGTFMVSAPPIFQASGTAVQRDITYHTLVIVFDAHTGNLVEEQAQ